MAGHSIDIKRERRILERESVAEISREKIREKSERIVLPLNPIPNQRRCAHVLRIAAVLNQPLTRTPTRTPCGEAGSEDSWLRLLSGSDKSKPTVRPNRQPI